MEQCANCGRMIGKLETPHLWNDRVVCAACRQALQSPVPPPRIADKKRHPVRLAIAILVAVIGISLAAFSIASRVATSRRLDREIREGNKYLKDMTDLLIEPPTARKDQPCNDP